jgi:two-component system sensor histidine kinase KdpD
MSRPQDIDQRPSPDALLREAAGENRGRLKIFMGAAPGVGKTYEMLTAAASLRAAGIDVVAALIETHGRRETEALLTGLDVIPRRIVEHRGQTLTEMDLDAVLLRHPQVALVDELAHTNAPGSRHAKRWQDVEELLDAGIDVYTTLNVQHVESLNDVVAQITSVRIRETVPDSILDAAHQIELIDLTPDDLIQRLHDGKVYIPAQAERALKNYFKPGNLTALRELALRRTADRVEDQVAQHMKANAISGPWPTNERVLVCLSDHPGARQLVRYARRAADRLHGRWIALYLEGQRHLALNEEQKDRVAEALRLAEQLGGEAVSLPIEGAGKSIAAEIIDYARTANVTHIIVGKSRRTKWFEFWHGSVVDALVRNASGISVHVVAEEALERQTNPAATMRGQTENPATAPFRSLDYAISALIVAIATGLAAALSALVELPNISLVYLTAVLISAVSYGLWPSLFASLLSALAYNFFFMPPLYTFTIADPANVLSLVFFFAVATLVSNLTGRAREQAVTLRQQARTTNDLYSFSRKLAASAALGDLLQAAVDQIARMLDVSAVVLMPALAGGKTELKIEAANPAAQSLDGRELAAAHWTLNNGKPSGRDTDTLPGGKFLFIPIKTAREVTAVLGVTSSTGDTSLLSPRQRRLLNALIDQTAVAIERVQLAGDIDAARLQAETERLRSALLASLSHDLRTPLASILGAITSLRGYDQLYTDAEREELLATAQAETERLNRFVGNLLDMTKLQSGVITPKLAPLDLGDLIGIVLRRAETLLHNHRVVTSIDPDFPELHLDHTLLEQVLFNLLDNAAKFAPPGTAIEVAAKRDQEGVILTVTDEGPGIPPDDLDHVFDKFYRANAGDRQRAGTGLGLSICRGMLEAMGGTIRAVNRADRSGAMLIVTLPATAIIPARATDD